MAHHESTLELIGKGAVAGIAGTAALTVGMQLLPHLLPQSGPLDPQRDQPEEPNVKLAENIALALWGRLPSDQTKAAGGQLIHWGYGASWGVMYALAQQRLQLPPNAHGLLLGLLVSTTASTVVPALALAPPPTREPIPQTAGRTALQLLFGWVTAQTFNSLSASHGEQSGQATGRRYDPYATHPYEGQPSGAMIEERFHQVGAPMPPDPPSMAEPRIRADVP